MIVVDANVVLSGLRSRNGASFAVLRGMLTGEIEFAASPAIVLEYEDVLKRPGLLGPKPWIAEHEIDVILDAICAKAVETLPWFRFRPSVSQRPQGRSLFRMRLGGRRGNDCFGRPPFQSSSRRGVRIERFDSG